MSSAERQLIANPLTNAADASYTQALVSFIDILGFRDLVDKKSPGEVAAAILRLQKTVETNGRKEERAASLDAVGASGVHAFSDCVVRIRPVSANSDFGRSFVRELADLASIQAALARSGVFVRGGVTFGEIFSTNKIVFGPALIRAHGLESQLCHVPRIVVDPATIQKFRKRIVPRSRMRREITAMLRSIRHGEDGLWFIDYLDAAADLLELKDEKKELLNAHRQSVIDAGTAIEVDSSVLPKYLWVANYHNAACVRVLGKSGSRGITLSRNQLPSFERLRLPALLKS